MTSGVNVGYIHCQICSLEGEQVRRMETVSWVLRCFLTLTSAGSLLDNLRCVTKSEKGLIEEFCSCHEAAAAPSCFMPA